MSNFDDRFWVLTITFDDKLRCHLRQSPLHDQFQQPILGFDNHYISNNKHQQKSTLMTNFAIWILGFDNKLLQPTSRSSSCNQFLPLTATYNYKLGWKLPLIINFNNHLQLHAPTKSPLIINFISKWHPPLMINTNIYPRQPRRAMATSICQLQQQPNIFL